MNPRVRKLPILSIAVVLGSLLVGLALAPVAAQRAGLTDGKVTVRSDGAVYLIANGQRRWVATVQITDDELNAYPEAEPIFAGLVPFGSSGATTASASKPSSSSGSSAGTPSSSAAPDPTPAPSGRTTPTGGECPPSHMIKGATTNGVKSFYEPDWLSYAQVKPEACFTAGPDARGAGYVQGNKNQP